MPKLLNASIWSVPNSYILIRGKVQYLVSLLFLTLKIFHPILRPKAIQETIRIDSRIQYEKIFPYRSYHAFLDLPGLWKIQCSGQEKSRAQNPVATQRAEKEEPFRSSLWLEAIPARFWKSMILTEVASGKRDKSLC